MPTAVIVVFFLFFAVLAFGWFYLQRAKARDAGAVVETATPATTVEAAPVSTTDTTDTPAS